MNKSFWVDKTVLITGHTGFKGTWLTLWLSQMGAKVVGISDKILCGPNLFQSTDANKLLHKNYFIDIRDYESLSKAIRHIQPDIVFHLAAQPLVRESYKTPLSTWETNVQGSLNTLESLKSVSKLCTCVMITTDKVYKNKEWLYGYRENDELGGHDPYSASKAAAELAIESWYLSFCKSDSSPFSNIIVSTARSGNVIGGGDWAEDRIIPDTMKSLSNNQSVLIRNPASTRPWQHVLEPLHGYIILAQKMYEDKLKNKNSTTFSGSFNFGPRLESNKNVESLVQEILKNWPGKYYIDGESHSGLHEANRLHLQIDKSYQMLDWKPKWNFSETILKTTIWYKSHFEQRGISRDKELCLADLAEYLSV